jgi:hypothetical protein
MNERSVDDIAMDPATLYREDVFTDRAVGTIRQLTPVSPDGAADSTRPILFAGQTQIMTQGGVLPLNFEIPAASLAQAVAQFGAAARQAIEDTMREIQELRRQAASQLVVPDAGTASQILSGPGPTGGGKIRLR